MTTSAKNLLRAIGKALAILVVGFPAIWGAFALWYQAPGGQLLRAVAAMLWMAFAVAMLVLLWRGRALLGLFGFVFAFAMLLVWWHALQPSNNRVWADEVAQQTTGEVGGARVILHNVRNFDWRTRTDYTPRWEVRGYELDHLHSVDMILSYWSGPAIAHVLVSFGFDDGEQVAFSVEIRREVGESFSEIGGFFKQFELSIIAADERDVVRLRTNVRGEDDYLYRIKMPVVAMRSLFLAYVEQANGLVRTPRFYNTVTANCTTLVYHMMNHIVGRLPLSYRLLLTGQLPEYVYAVGGLDTRYSIEQLRAGARITDKALQSERNATFSADIRRGIPGVEP